MACGAPALWCNDTAGRCWLADGQGVIIGQLFSKRSTSRVVDFSEAETKRIVASDGAALIDDYWGAYVAILVSSDGRGFTVVRDPSGFMPCYRAEAADHHVLASDLQALADAGVPTFKVQWDRLFEHLQAIDARRVETCVEGVAEVGPGAAFTTLQAGSAQRAMWNPWMFTGRAGALAPAETADCLRATVCQCVSTLASQYDHIIVGLSGGLDSSIVCAALAYGGHRFSCLTMATPDPSGDERRYAAQVADAAGAPLSAYVYDVDRIDLRRSASAHLPRPVAKPFMQEIVRAYHREMQAIGADAIFTGNGGDNVFCFLHSAAPIIDRLRSEWSPAGAVRTFLHMCALTQSDIGTMGKAVWTSLFRAPSLTQKADMRLLGQARPAAGVTPLLTPWLDEAPTQHPGKIGHVRLLMKIQNFIEGYDRSAYPPVLPVLLAQPIVETCLRIPSWDWCRGGINRSTARRAFDGLLPDPILRRTSKAGPDSLTAAVFDAGRPILRELLLGGVLRQNRLIDPAAIETALSDPLIVRGQLFYRLLDIADSEAWARSRVSDSGSTALRM